MSRKLFARIIKSTALTLILTCSLLFTDIGLTQQKDSGTNPETEQSDSSDESNTVIYVGVAAIMVALALYLLVFKKPEEKNEETEKNKDIKDSTKVIKSDTTQLKKQ